MSKHNFKIWQLALLFVLGKLAIEEPADMRAGFDVGYNYVLTFFAPGIVPVIHRAH
ncbi:MAG: hypothetical protein ABJC26_08985 [Gemmatimonadaceae bacterium]